ncbi:hypothetical protein V8C86DRAFT_2467238 [Haematococcus lacustris]
MVLLPLTSYIMEILPEEQRDTTKGDLGFEDFEKILPDDLSHIVEWLTEKVDALSTRLKAEPAKPGEELEDEENMGDTDLWQLTADGSALTVNSRWLQHLQERLLGEDGQPRKVKAPEDPHRCGLVLEWVFGSIVSTAEKARDGARRNLGSYLPMPVDAHHSLVRVLEEQSMWDSRLRQARELQADILKSRLEASEQARQLQTSKPSAAKPAQGEDGGVGGSGVLGEEAPPDSLCVSMLRRESLLTKAKLHVLLWEHINQDKQLRTWKLQLKQGEPEFERLKRELDEVKHSHRGLDGTYRSQAEMDRHRAQLADAAIEEQLEVQTAFREQGALLQAIYDSKLRAEHEMVKRETEVKQLQGWKGTVENLLDKFLELMAAKGQGDVAALTPTLPAPGAAPGAAAEDKPGPAVEADASAEASVRAGEQGPGGKREEQEGAAAGDRTAAAGEGDGKAGLEPTAKGQVQDQGQGGASSGAGGLTPQQFVTLNKLRAHFQKDVRKQLYSNADDRLIFDSLKAEIKLMEQRCEEGRVAVQHLEMNLINVACDDPGIAIGAQLVLPVLQEALEERAVLFRKHKAEAAELEVIRMEAEQAQREAAERERKRAAKASKRDKVKSEREKERAERAAREAAEAVRRQEKEQARALREEEERRKRLEALEAKRQEEEEARERRRQELLSDEHGYWRQRMRLDEELLAAAEAESLALTQDHSLADAKAGGEAGGEGGTAPVSCPPPGTKPAYHPYSNGGSHQANHQANHHGGLGAGYGPHPPCCCSSHPPELCAYPPTPCIANSVWGGGVRIQRQHPCPC